MYPIVDPSGEVWEGGIRRGQKGPSPKRTPWKMNTEPTNQPFGKENDLKQTSMIMFHVNLPGCKICFTLVTGIIKLNATQFSGDRKDFPTTNAFFGLVRKCHDPPVKINGTGR